MSVSQQITGSPAATPKRLDLRRFDLRSALVTTALGTGVLMGASLISGGQALACVDVTDDPNSVSCADAQTTTDDTLDVTAAGADSTDNDERHYLFSDHGAVDVDVTAAGAIDGFGLAVTNDDTGEAIVVDHQGAISIDDGNIATEGGFGVFRITTDGGNVTYTGNGSVIDNDGLNPGLVIDTSGGNIDIGALGTPVMPGYQGSTALSTDSGAGGQNIFLEGGTLVTTAIVGTGLSAVSTTGDINVMLTGNTSITSTAVAPLTLEGMRAASSGGGSVTISSDADIGTAGAEFTNGIVAITANAGGIAITQTGGTILATSAGIGAQATGANSGIAITTDAGSLIGMLGGTGIIASQTGTGGGVAVTVDGDITGADTGVQAQIDNAANPDDVLVTASGDIQANTNQSIAATTIGTGNVTVSLLDGATMEGGVLAQSTTGNAAIMAGNNVTVIGNSPGMESITAGGDATVAVGDNAVVTGSSGIVVDQTNPAGAGVATVEVGADGLVRGNGGDPTDDYSGNGIFAGNQGTGATSVTTGTGTRVIGEANGIVAFQTNAANTSDITITTDGPVRGDGDEAFVLAPYTDAFVAAGLPTTGIGIGASSEGSGDIIVSTGDTVFGTNAGIQTLTSSAGAISITTGGETRSDRHAIIARSVTGNITVASGDRVLGDIDGSGSGDGINAASQGGNIDVTTSAPVRGARGIVLSTTGGGTIDVAAGNRVTGAVGDGIRTFAEGGATTIATEEVLAAASGIRARSTGGAISITTNDRVIGDTDGDGTGAGINAASSAAGNIDVTTSALVRGARGIVLSTTAGGTLDIAAGGRVVGTTGDGITTTAENGATTIATEEVFGAGNGIRAESTGGAISITTNDRVIGDTDGNGTGAGINAASSAAGNIDVTTLAAVRGARGIVIATNGAGTVDLTTGGPVLGTTGDAIVTSAVDGNTTIAANANVTGEQDGIDATATGAGDLDITVSGGARVTGTTGSGIVTDTATGNTTIDNAGLVQGTVAAISGASDTLFSIVNHAGGVIRNLSLDLGDLAIAVTGGGMTDIDNEPGGIIAGRIETGTGNDSLTNSGVWRTTGVSDFGAGSDTIFNDGRLVAAVDAAVAEQTHLANLETFINAGTGIIDMVDENAPGVGDMLTIDGTYTGLPGSTILFDLALVAGDPQAGSDLLVLNPANTAGGTSDFLFNIVSTGVTATTADMGRVVFAGGQELAAPVTVVENRGDLTTSSGEDNIPLARSGLINYDLVSTAASGGDYQVVSQFDPSLAGGILLPIGSTLATVAFATQRTPNPITATCIDPDNKPNAQGGWARGFAGQFETEAAGEAVSGGMVSDLESENTTRFRTLQGGFDHVICNLDSHGSTLHLGVTVGQTWGDSSQTDIDPAAGVFGTDIDFDTFFFGPYAAFTRGNFALQAAVRFDHHSLELTNPTAGIDADGVKLDADGISGSTSASYDFEVGDLTVTPDLGVNVSTTEIDDFEVAGGTVVSEDLWSVIGHAGVSARTTITVTDRLFVVPFAAATLYHEFVEHADTSLILGGTTIEAESNRVGTFGQLGIGANAVRLGNVLTGHPTLFGGARFDLQVGERIQGATATVFGRVQF